ncbi:MAG: HEPN domain-containing protein [Verrucomicrobiae bacterium]|nr:HEPN domain-containing protein [Verrucomicrobiae bacterium]
MRSEAKNPQNWFDFAEEDLVRAYRRFSEGDFSDCLFHLQQCAEKAMKGRLIALGWQLQKIHDLAPLIEELATAGVDCRWFDESADVLATEYVATRYPGFEDAPVATEELRTLVLNTTKLFEQLTGRTYSGPPLPA